MQGAAADIVLPQDAAPTSLATLKAEITEILSLVCDATQENNLLDKFKLFLKKISTEIETTHRSVAEALYESASDKKSITQIKVEIHAARGKIAPSVVGKAFRLATSIVYCPPQGRLLAAFDDALNLADMIEAHLKPQARSLSDSITDADYPPTEKVYADLLLKLDNAKARIQVLELSLQALPPPTPSYPFEAPALLPERIPYSGSEAPADLKAHIQYLERQNRALQQSITSLTTKDNRHQGAQRP